MASMIQAIRDLADAFVPSGKLIQLVDKELVSRQSDISLYDAKSEFIEVYDTLKSHIALTHWSAYLSEITYINDLSCNN